MINYYKLRVSYFKIDTENKNYEQVNKALDSKSLAKVTNESAFNGLNKASSENTGGEWVLITEEEYNTTKIEVLSILNS